MILRAKVAGVNAMCYRGPWVHMLLRGTAFTRKRVRLTLHTYNTITAPTLRLMHFADFLCVISTEDRF